MDSLKNIEESISENGYAVFNCDVAEDFNPERMVGHNALVLCTGGMAVVEVNMVEYTLKTDMCMFMHPTMTVLRSVSEDFKAVVLQTSPETSLSSSIGLETEVFNVLYREPCFEVVDYRVLTILSNLIENLRLFTQLQASSHKKDFVYATLQCIFIAIYDMRLRMLSQAKPHNASYTSADNYFRHFLVLIKENCKMHHDVAFYADRLHITPKYLNEISRKKVHITAKEVITQFIVTMIKRELLVSGNSVQRIAYDYNFCDQSSLGKFFKKATGMSPVAFRRTR